MTTSAVMATYYVAEAGLLLEKAEGLYRGMKRPNVAEPIGELAAVTLAMARLLDIQDQRVRRAEPSRLLRRRRPPERIKM